MLTTLGLRRDDARNRCLHPLGLRAIVRPRDFASVRTFARAILRCLRRDFALSPSRHSQSAVIRQHTSWSLAVLVTAALGAQQTPQQTPVFRGGITIVPLTVTVLDKNGKPVTDLTQTDFTILEDGTKQQIKTFFADALRPQEPTADSQSPAVPRSPFTQAKPANRRTFLLVLGYGHVQAPVKAADGALEFIRERLLPQDLVAVIAFNRATNFQTNHELAAATVERFKERHANIVERIDEFYCPIYHVGYPLPPDIQADIDAIFQPDALRTAGMKPLTGLLQGSDSFEKDRANAVAKAGAASPAEKPLDTRIALQDILKVYAGIEYLRNVEGTKHLVWFSEKGLAQKGLPRPECNRGIPGALQSQSGFAAGTPTDLAGRAWTKQEDEQIARRAGDAGVVADIIHTWGVDPLITPNLRLQGGSTLGSESDFIQSSEYITELTGGQFTGNSYASEMLHRIDDATRFSYLLGYTPTNPSFDDGFRHVEVKVNRPGLTVLYRHGYTATADPRPLDLRQLLTTSRLNAAAVGEEDTQDIKLQAKATVVSGLGASRRLVIDLTIDASRLSWGQDGDRHTGALDIRVFCSDGNAIVGEMDDSIDSNLTEADFQRTMKSGIRTSVRVPVTGDPKYVKVLVYDYRADLLGTASVKLK